MIYIEIALSFLIFGSIASATNQKFRNKCLLLISIIFCCYYGFEIFNIINTEQYTPILVIDQVANISLAIYAMVMLAKPISKIFKFKITANLVEIRKDATIIATLLILPHTIFSLVKIISSQGTLELKTILAITTLLVLVSLMSIAIYWIKKTSKKFNKEIIYSVVNAGLFFILLHAFAVTGNYQYLVIEAICFVTYFVSYIFFEEHQKAFVKASAFSATLICSTFLVVIISGHMPPIKSSSNLNDTNIEQPPAPGPDENDGPPGEVQTDGAPSLNNSDDMNNNNQPLPEPINN